MKNELVSKMFKLTIAAFYNTKSILSLCDRQKQEGILLESRIKFHTTQLIQILKKIDVLLLCFKGFEILPEAVIHSKLKELEGNDLFNLKKLQEQECIIEKQRKTINDLMVKLKLGTDTDRKYLDSLTQYEKDKRGIR